MNWRLVRQIAVDLALGAGLCVVGQSCDDGELPKQPDTSLPSSVATEGAGSSTASETATATAGGADEQEPGAESTGSGTGTSQSPADVTYQLGGAAIGDEATIQAVKGCLENKAIYDRFTGSGECTSVQAAKLDCHDAGIRLVLSAKQIQQFDESLAGTYAGWTIDQCADCPPDSTASVCTDAQGAAQTGTKVLFVREAETGIQGKSMVLPLRPNQPKT